MANRSLIDRMKGAARLDVATYEEVEHDVTATGQAAAVIAIGAAASAIGSYRFGPMGMGIEALRLIAGVAIFAALAYFVGKTLFDADASWGEVFRALGFAWSPAVFFVLAFLPAVGWAIEAVVSLWVLWALVIAMRQSLDVSTLKALATGVLAFAAWMLLDIVF